MLIVRGHSIHSQTDGYSCGSVGGFSDRKCLDPRGTRTSNLLIHVEMIRHVKFWYTLCIKHIFGNGHPDHSAFLQEASDISKYLATGLLDTYNYDGVLTAVLSHGWLSNCLLGNSAATGTVFTMHWQVRQWWSLIRPQLYDHCDIGFRLGFWGTSDCSFG